MLAIRRLVRAQSIRSMSSSVEPELLLSQQKQVGIITLNRPKALNSLNLQMCRDIKRKLLDWHTVDKSVGAFIVKGVGGKSFCAGGDVKSIYLEIVGMSAELKKDLGTGKRGMLSSDFFRTEYEMNYLLGTSNVPQVSIWDGIVMGGGVGLSVLGEFRIATEKSLFAMPETAIGLFPDVGSSAWLPHLKGGQGLYIGLTGARLNAMDLIETGIATHYIPSDKIPEVEKIMIETCSVDPNKAREEVKVILSQHSCQITDPGIISKSDIVANKEIINKCFSGVTSIEDVFNRLSVEASSNAWADKTLKTLNKMSPNSLKITMRQLQDGKNLDLKKCLEMEFKVVMNCMKAPDFTEGIRALLIDKDNNPNWSKKSIQDVKDEDVAAYFTLSSDNELQL